MTDQLVSSVHSKSGLCHISDKAEVKNGFRYNTTRCGKRLKRPWTDFHSIRNQCPRCGDARDYRAVMDLVREREAAQERQRQQGLVRNQVRLVLRNEQRRRLAPEIQQALEHIGAQVELEYQLHGAKLTGSFGVDGQEHHFSMVLKR